MGGLEAAVVPSQNPAAQTPAALAMGTHTLPFLNLIPADLATEKKSSSTAEQLQLVGAGFIKCMWSFNKSLQGRMPDQEFKYFRLVLMQEAIPSQIQL